MALLPGGAKSTWGRSVMNMWPGAWKIAGDGRASSATTWAVTPHAQKTGISPGAEPDRIAEVGCAQVNDAEFGWISGMHRACRASLESVTVISRAMVDVAPRERPHRHE